MMAIFGLPEGVLCIPDLKQVEEPGHHKYLSDLLVDILDNHFASFCRGLLADREEESETRTTNVLQIGAIENDCLVGILK